MRRPTDPQMSLFAQARNPAAASAAPPLYDAAALWAATSTTQAPQLAGFPPNTTLMGLPSLLDGAQASNRMGLLGGLPPSDLWSGVTRGADMPRAEQARSRRASNGSFTSESSRHSEDGSRRRWSDDGRGNWDTRCVGQSARSLLCPKHAEQQAAAWWP